MEYKNVDYLTLIREEFAKVGVKEANRVTFCKVKKPITQENVDEKIAEYFIPEPDVPTYEGLIIIPLSITSYPKILSSMSANQAGYWAIRKCKQQKWHISDYECCLANLEMDM